MMQPRLRLRFRLGRQSILACTAAARSGGVSGGVAIPYSSQTHSYSCAPRTATVWGVSTHSSSSCGGLIYRAVPHIHNYVHYPGLSHRYFCTATAATNTAADIDATTGDIESPPTPGQGALNITTPLSPKENFKYKEDRFWHSRKRKVFIGNLYLYTTEDDIFAHMSSIGDIACINIMRNRDGTSKRCALVEFKNEESVQQAVAQLNKSVLRKHIIVVRPDVVKRIDRNIEDRAVNMKHSRVLTSEDDIGIGDSQDKMATKSQNIKELMNRSRSVFVGQLSSELDNVGLRKYFEDAGYGVVYAKVFMTSSNPPRSKCCGKVLLREGTKINEVIDQLNGGQVLGRKILVKENELKLERKYIKPVEGVRVSQPSHNIMNVLWNTEEKLVDTVPSEEGDQGVDPARSMYVSNLDFSVSHKRLVQFIVNDMIMSDKKMEESVRKVKKVQFLVDTTGQSRGRAFVEFENAGDAQEAVHRIHGTPLRGRFVFARKMNTM